MSDMSNAVFCPHCMDFVASHTEVIREVYPVKGVEIEVLADVIVCDDCHSKLFDRDLDEKNLSRAYILYRDKFNLLSPERIRAIREKYSLSQVAFAKVLGLGEKTIARYETGSLPDEAQNNLILLTENVDNFSQLLWKNQDKLKPQERADAMNACDRMRRIYHLDFAMLGGEECSGWSYDLQDQSSLRYANA